MLIKAAIPQIAEATRMAFMGDPSIPSYAIRAINGTEAEIAGGIKYGLTRDFEKLLEQSPGVRVVRTASAADSTTMADRRRADTSRDMQDDAAANPDHG